MQQKQQHDSLYHYSCKINQYQSIYKNDKIRLNTSKTHSILVTALSLIATQTPKYLHALLDRFI